MQEFALFVLPEARTYDSGPKNSLINPLRASRCPHWTKITLPALTTSLKGGN